MDDRFPEDPDLAFHPSVASEGHLSQWQGSCVASITSLLQRSHIQFWDEIVIHQNTQRNSFQTWTLLWAGTHQWSGIAQRIVMSWVVHFLDTNNLIQLNQDVLTKVERRYGQYPFTVMWSSLPYSAYHFSDNVKHILKYPRPTFPIWVVSRKTWLHCLKNDKELWSDNSEVSLKLDVT